MSHARGSGCAQEVNCYIVAKCYSLIVDAPLRSIFNRTVRKNTNAVWKKTAAVWKNTNAIFLSQGLGQKRAHRSSDF
jgi:hypothetical protein